MLLCGYVVKLVFPLPDLLFVFVDKLNDSGRFSDGCSDVFDDYLLTPNSYSRYLLQSY